MLWRLSAMGTELAFGIVGMVLLGLGIDYLFKTGPKGVVICTIIGVLGSSYNFIRRAVELNKRASRGVRGAGRSAPKPTGDGHAKGASGPEKNSEESDDDLRYPPDFDEY